jgi:hypothetical protein
MAFEIKPEEATLLEAIEQRERRRIVTSKVFKNLPKKKLLKYRQQIADITSSRFNDQQLREKLVKGIYKRNGESNNIMDAMARGEV